MRTRTHIMGIPGVDPSHAKELETATELLRRMCILLHVAHGAGAEFMVENPIDRGDRSDSKFYHSSDHGPLWLMPDLLTLSAVAGCLSVSFAQCRFGSDTQKYTTFLYTPGFHAMLAPLADMACNHGSHPSPAGGYRDEHGVWNSAEHAAFPPSLNYFLAQACARVGQQHAMESVSPRGNLPKRPLPSEEHASSDSATEPPPRRPPVPTQPPGLVPLLPSPAPAVEPRIEPPLGEAPLTAEEPGDADGSHDSSDAPELGNLHPPAEAQTKHNPAGRAPVRTRSRTAAALAYSCAFSCAHVIFPRLGHGGASCPALTASTGKTDDPPNRPAALRLWGKESTEKSESKELHSHASNKSWVDIDRCDLPPGRKLVKFTWVYKKKRDGSLKSRLCVQGCTQIPGVDYDQTHCATMRSSSLRLLSAIASGLSLNMRRWDFASAYLQGSLIEGEVVYCYPPPGYEQTDVFGEPRLGRDGLTRICRVEKPIYGMAQAGRRWQRSIFPWIESQGFTASSSDRCVFVKRKTMQTPKGPREEIVILGCYVDDLFVLYSHTDAYSLYHDFTTQLEKDWEVDDEGEVSDLLNVEITREGSDVVLRQTQYILKLVSTYAPSGVPKSFQSSKAPCDEHMPQRVCDALLQEVTSVDPALLKRYQSLVGALLYCSTQTRPDVAFAVGYLCRAMGKPTEALYTDALHVLYYLHHHKEVGLRYSPSKSPLSGMSDSDWAVKHSTSGMVFMYQTAAISWGSKKQATIALSSTEAEIVAASESAKEAISLRTFLDDLDLGDPEPLRLSVDNQSAIAVSYNPEHHSKMKHVERRHFFIRECVENMQIVVPFVSTVDNIADFFTKPLSPKKFFAMRNMIMNHVTTADRGKRAR